MNSGHYQFMEQIAASIETKRLKIIQVAPLLKVLLLSAILYMYFSIYVA